MRETLIRMEIFDPGTKFDINNRQVLSCLENIVRRKEIWQVNYKAGKIRDGNPLWNRRRTGRSGASYLKSTSSCKGGRGDRTSGTGSGGYGSV